MRDFTKYEVWKLSHELTLDIYKICATFPVTEKYQIISQMQGAAYSVPSNIAKAAEEALIKSFTDFLKSHWDRLMKWNISSP